MNGLKVRDSKIEGKGLFADKEFNEGDIIGIAHINDVATSMIGRFHNHSDNPNAHSISIGNKRYLAALRPLIKGEEITVDYRKQPELEQPEEFKKGGLVKMPKPSKKGLASKKYTKSLLGTNRLFTKNPLYEKPKSKKNRVYDPNAKYYQTGGSSGKPDPKTSFYSVEGSDGVYRKVGNTWEVDWNRSGNFQPLSKGDVAKRTAVLNSQAKPLYDPTYDDIYTTKQSAYTEKPKAAPVKNVTPQDRAAQQAFNKDFKVTDKSNFEVVQDKINQDKQNYIEHAKERGYEATQDELDQLEERGWVQYGNVGASPNPYSMKQAGPAEKPQEFWDKAGDIISNPMTSAGFLMRGQAIPDYMQRNMDRGTFGYYANGQFHTERNPLDLAVADATGLSLVNDARNVYKGIENRDVAQAGFGALGFVPGVTELKNARKAIQFAGPMKHTFKDVPEVLTALRQRGQYWDNAGAVGKDLLHPDMINYHGTYSGRPIVEVRMPDGSSEMFYKSSGWAGKKGSGVNNTTEGMWQVYGGHANNPLNQADNWFVKDYGFEDYYGSNTFGNMAENMDNALMQKLNFKSVDELDNAFNFQNRFGDVDSYTPKQTGGESGDRFKKRLMKRYPGMQGVYGPEGENLNIVKDPNYDARSVGYGDIEFSFPGDPYLRYDNIIPKDDPNYIDVEEYIYSNIEPDKYNSVYNPRGANRRDVFLDMMHGMRDDPNFQPFLQNFEKAVKNTRGEDMDWQYEGEVQSGSTQSKERFDENYVDGQLRAELAPKTIGRFSKGRKDYRMERKYDSPEMRAAAKDIRNYIKGEYQDGGEPGKIRFVPGTYDPNEMAGYMLDTPEVTVAQKGAPWVKYMREYEKKNPMDKFVDQKKRTYLKLHPGLNKSAGVTMENFPVDVLQNFVDEYEYNKNSYVTKKYGKEAGFNPSRRGEWVDEINPTFKERFVADSKYGSKLQPSTWDRALAGLTTLASPFSPDLQAELNAGMPGLTRRESREIKDANLAGIPIGGLEAFAPVNTLGQNIANLAKNRGLSYGSDYKQLPGFFSGENMANVTDIDAMALDPIQMALAVSGVAELPIMLGKGSKVAAKLMNTEDGLLSRALGSSDNSLELGQASKTVYPTEEVTMAKPASQEPWRMEPMSGLHLKATMSDGPIAKTIEPKTGLIKVDSALNIIRKESGGEEKVKMIKAALGENIPEKMDFNEFRKVVQDQLIPLEKQIVDHSSAFGLDRIGFGADINSNIPVNDTELLENKTIIFSNKNEFGRGSGAHNNPDETLGHVHYFRTSEEPEVLHISQIQSDAFQGTHRTALKTKEQAEFNYKRQLEYYNKNKEKLEGITQLPDGDYQFADGQKISKSAYNTLFSGIDEALELSKAELKNFNQKQLLDKNHQERYIQEIVQSAAERGDVNRIRIPTAETAAQIQGYRKQPVDPGNKFRQLRESIIDAMDSGDSDLLDQANKVYSEEYQKALAKGELDYADEHKTILKKYKELPKTIKKLYGIEPKIVPDGKGNTWYEFNIPYEFREGPGEIKAFRRGGNISKLKKFIN